jgi:hypothetical protein
MSQNSGGWRSQSPGRLLFVAVLQSSSWPAPSPGVSVSTQANEADETG